MPEVSLTLNNLLGLPDERFSKQVFKAGVSPEDLVSIKGTISSAIGGLSWEHVEQSVCAKISEQLNLSPMDVITYAWAKYQVLAESAKQSKTGETVFLGLDEHSITSKLHPYLEIQLGPKVIKRIDFDVSITLRLKGLVLKIEDGKIKSIEAGVCEGSGEIQVRNISIWEHEIKPIELPGKINLGSGIAID